MYEVINYFTDLQDFNHPYHVGDIFPRDGIKVTEERLKELSGKKNKRGLPLIKLKHSEDNVLESYTKTQINRMSTAELKDVAIKNGISDAENLTGGVLKKRLIEHFNL